jgi:hypothetical protein
VTFHPEKFNEIFPEIAEHLAGMKIELLFIFQDTTQVVKNSLAVARRKEILKVGKKLRESVCGF